MFRKYLVFLFFLIVFFQCKAGTMKEDDEQARKARAESIRKQIDQLKAGKGVKESPDNKGNQPGSETPAEFIHRRMEELDSDKNGSKSDE